MSGSSSEQSMSAILLDQADRLFGQHVTKAILAGADEGQWPADLWQAVEEAGLPLALVAEEAGGVGLAAAEAGLLVRRAAFHAAPVPLAETILAQSLWTRAGGEPLEGPVTLAPTNARDVLRLDGDTLSGTASRVPWGAQAGHILVLAKTEQGEARLCLVANPLLRHAEERPPAASRSTQGAGASFETPSPRAPQDDERRSFRPGIQDEDGRGGAGSVVVRPARNVAFEPRETLVFEGVRVADGMSRPAPADLGGSLLREGAAMRSQQMVGAMERCLDHALTYVNERVQFGRPLGKFQAIQHMLALAAGHTAAAAAAADALGEAAGTPSFPFAVAVAKARTGEAAGQVAAICHQAHGAMGFTREHPLHFSTRRLFAWRDEFGGEAHWQAEIGRLVCSRGGDALWPLVAGETETA